MNSTNIKEITDVKKLSGNVTAPLGFLAAGEHIGVKRKRRDLALIKCEVPATAAGVFTQNRVKAAPVLWNHKKVLGKINGLVVNSGNANACTGDEGARNVERMAETYAECLGVDKDSILVASTGVIGVQLPMETITIGIKNTFPQLGKGEPASSNAAEGIMTTDKFPKEIAIETEISGEPVRIGGIAKGSGMIHPNMATMLAFITTDANIDRELLQKALKESVADSYNMISVDGDTSTNDSVIVLASGLAKNRAIKIQDSDYEKFKSALHYVNLNLAKQIVLDGEGAEKFLEVTVNEAKTKQDARLIAKAIIGSNLVKTAMFGADANWGRVLCAAGYSGAEFDPTKASIEFSSNAGSIITYLYGEPVVIDEEKAKKVLQEKEIKVIVSLKDGNETATAWGCDLSYEYVRINGEYRT